MGNSRWDEGQYTAYASTTSYRSMKAADVFTHTKLGKVHEKLDPRNVKVGKGDRKGLQLRESIISEENPQPTPIILGLDVTGSMGDVAGQIAKDELPKIMTEIHKRQDIISDPHVMFMGIDDVHEQGHGALQVSYFEPDLRIVEQLRNMWLVKNGGGNGSESYDLAWYFAGKYTYLEGFEKLGRKGFLFTFGDEPAPYQDMTPDELEIIFGKGNYEKVSPAQSLKLAEEKYHVFHIIVEHGHRGGRTMRESWRDLLGQNVLYVQDPTKLTDVIIATMEVVLGAKIDDVIAQSESPEALRYAFESILNG